MTAILLVLLTTLSFADDASPKEIDVGLYASSQTGVAYMTTATDSGWYIEAMDRTGALLMDKTVVGALTEEDAVRVAVAAHQSAKTRFEVALGDGKTVEVVVGDKLLAVRGK